jgi:hypothetical protein
MKFENPIELFPTGSIETPDQGYVNMFLDTGNDCGFVRADIAVKLPNGRTIRIRHD